MIDAPAAAEHPFDNDPPKLTGPFSPIEIAALTARQSSTSLHPYTCPEQHAAQQKLTADVNGYVCPICGHTKEYVWASECIPLAGMVLWNPGSFHNGLFDAAMLTPFELVRNIGQGKNYLAAEFRLILPKTGHPQRRLPWFGRAAGIPMGTKEKNGGDTPNGQVYLFGTREVREYIKRRWDEKQEAAQLNIVRVKRARQYAMYDLDNEPAGGPMPGTDRRIVADTRRRLLLMAKGTDPGPLNHNYLTPRLLRNALITLPETPALITFTAPFIHPTGFPWFMPPENSSTRLYENPYPRCVNPERDYVRAYPGPDVFRFLLNETTDAIEADAREKCRAALKRPHGESFLVGAELGY